MKVFSLENAYVVERAQVIKTTEGSNECHRYRRDGGYSTGVIVHGMLSKGFVRNLGEPVPSSDKGVLKTEETRGEDEGQVVGSTHSVR